MKNSIGLALVLLSCSLALIAQTENASISGRVTDPSGAAVIDAGVLVTDVDTGISLSVKTNNSGFYVATGLRPGRYRVTISKEGFQTVNLTGVELNLQDYLSKNFELKVGSASEQVTVVADAMNINTTDGSVSTVVDQTYIKNMPLNGRSFQDLILLTPGTVTQTPQIGSTGVGGLGLTGEFSVNGQRTESNYYTVDGVSANVGAAAGSNMTLGAAGPGSLPSATALGTTQALVSVDDLQEFRVQSSTYSAEYGRNPGGQFSFETKSGTNQWHGTAYNYLRNDFFDANDWFNNFFGVKEPPLRQNDFGGTLGGPVRLPHLYNGEDKTFFFFNYEGLRLTSPQPAASSLVPDAALRASAPTPLNQALNAWPVPNGPEVLQPCVQPTDPQCGTIQPGMEPSGIATYIASWSNPSSIDSTSVRFDHVVNQKMRVFFRFSDTASDSASRFGGVSSAAPPTMKQSLAYTLRTYTGGVTSLLTNRLSNEFRLNYSSNESTSIAAIDAFGGSTPVDLAQLEGLGAGSNPHVTLILGGSLEGLQQSRDSGTQRHWNLVDTASLSMGRHQLKFGIDYRRLAPFAVLTTPTVSYLFTSQQSVQSGNADRIVLGSQAPAYPLYKNFSAFAEDEWKVLPRLSLSMGLRWDVNPPPGVTQGLKPFTFQGSSPATWALAPQGTPLWRTTWYNFAPRLGGAYIVHSKQGWETVLRGGGGVFFDTAQQLGSLGFNGPGFSGFGVVGGPVAFPSPVTPPALDSDLANIGLAYVFAPHLQLPYTLQWNASMDQALGKSQALTFSYVGSHSSKLIQTNQYLPSSNPAGADFTLVQNGLTSDYDSAQVQFRRRLSQGFTALGSYTWSHCLDYGSSNNLVGYQRGNCDFDVRHNFSAAFSYDVPSVAHNGFANALLHHWGFDDRFTARSGFPITLNGSSILDPITGQLTHSGLDLVQGQPLYVTQCVSPLPTGPAQIGCPGGQGINPKAFSPVPVDPNTGEPTRLGTTPRNFARGLGALQMDFAVRREFPIYERLKLQFRAEAFNIFNHANFGVIDGNCGGTPGVPGCTNPTFGEARATLANSLGVLSPLYQQGGSRSLQFALKAVF
jgi:hypothetical protein